jgi:hypothetical protein
VIPGWSGPLSEDHVFDALAVVIFVVLPFALASVGLAVAIRSSSLSWRVVGYALAVGGTWVGVVAGVAFVQCPAQDETCGNQDVVGDVGLLVAAVVGLEYALLGVVHHWKSRRSRSFQSARSGPVRPG